MMMARRASFSLPGFALLLTICMAGSAVAKEPVFTTVDIPGASNTSLSGINSEGDIVGTYSSPAAGQNGFLLSRGVVTNINFGRYTIPSGINSEREVVGYHGSAIGEHGFLWSKGVFTVINAPGGSPGGGIYPPVTHPLGISSQGDIVGSWQLYTGGVTPVHGFLMMKGAFISIDFPGASYTFACGINPAGDIVGYYVNNTGFQHGFLLTKGRLTMIDVPGASFTVASGINPRGDIVGYYGNPDSSFHGFLLSKGEFTTIDVPGASGTAAAGINPKGDIVGVYFVGTISHGFLLSK